ncbi:MAG: anaerobic ribonucleoside-triphosphate reductase [Candidatus Bathyarchaeota archaeon]|nr:anaerobic ribonucleoside-triphosphate reductase [Candidatus Bathyarchaeota archaeon]MDH5734096.1 anaerobic ribonucleoside-triphosphate reductase [Candidatus Bathyarchaeota archaeon]
METSDSATNDFQLKVRRSDGFIVPWNRNAIVKQLVTETKLGKEFYDIRSMSLEEAEEIAIDVEKRIFDLKLRFVSGPLVRELVNNILLDKSKESPEYSIYRNILTRVGTPVYDAYLIDIGQGFKAKENANLQPNPETAHKRKADWVSGEEYLLLMPHKLADAHLSGDLHIHDLEYFGTRPFCQDWDLRYFFYYGLMPDGIGTRTSIAGPAKHPEVAILHTAKILASAQTNFAGGEGFYNFLVFLAPYMRGVDYKKVRQLMQMMFFEYTQAYVARGGQLVFSNIQVQPGVPELWRKVPIVAKGRIGPDLYGDYEDEVRLMFKALYNVAYEGDYWGKPFNFPKLENTLSPEFFKPEYDEFWLDVHKVVAKFGIPYFDNLMPPYRGYGKGVSCYQCCAYCFVETPEDSPDFEDKLYFNGGKHFTMGSWQVVSLNLPRMAYRANGEDDRLFEESYRLMDSAVEIFKIKKKWMDLVAKHNRIPFATQRPLDPRTRKKGTQAVDFDQLTFTIGFVGGNEMAQWHTGYQLHENSEAIKILVKLILKMQRYKELLEEKTGLKLALARTPAESTAQRFATADLLTNDYRDKAEKLVKGDLSNARSSLAEGGRDVPIYYSNGTHLDIGAKVGLLDRIDIEQKFFPLLNGGNMFHVWLGDASPDPEALYKLTKRIATKTHVGYYAYTKDLTICNSCGRVTSPINGNCPNCGSSNVEWWSRVTGYYQAVSGWNEGKKKELLDRYRTAL